MGLMSMIFGGESKKESSFFSPFKLLFTAAALVATIGFVSNQFNNKANDGNIVVNSFKEGVDVIGQVISPGPSKQAENISLEA